MYFFVITQYKPNHVDIHLSNLWIHSNRDEIKKTTSKFNNASEIINYFGTH